MSKGRDEGRAGKDGLTGTLEDRGTVFFKFYSYEGREESLGKDLEVETHGTRSSVNPNLSDLSQAEHRGAARARQRLSIVHRSSHLEPLRIYLFLSYSY